MSGNLSTAAVIIISIFIAAAELIIFDGRCYMAVILIVALMACLPYFTSKGGRRAAPKEIWILILSALFSSAIIALGNVFSFLRPFTAVTIAAGMMFGPPAGFTCGVFSTLIFSIFSGVGSWTSFQVIALGFIGAAAGFCRFALIRGNIFIIVFSVVSSFLYSCVDLLDLIWEPGTGFSFNDYPTVILHSIKWFLLYAFADVIMLILIKRKLYRKLIRMKRRFRIFEYSRG